MTEYRIGHGYDAHKLIESQSLIICGTNIESSAGSLGHSDGDVGYHSICDAIFGALALGDLGTYFPSSDKKWKDVSSIIFIQKAVKLMNDAGYRINNIDCTIILESPHINQYIPEMKNNISLACKVDRSAISIKATTTDKLGFIGRGEGIASSTIILLAKDSNVN